MLQALILLRKYWPIIKVILAVVRRNKPMLDRLIDRPDTGPKEDTRDFVRKVDWNEYGYDDNDGIG